MPTTRSQGLPENEALQLTHIPRTRKRKLDKGSKATEVSQTPLPSSVAESPLFKLPPELQTMIYRFAIVADEDVDITESAGIPEPGLLSVSKIVRFESYKLFYHENTFSCVVENFSPTTLLLAHRKKLLVPPDSGIGIAAPLLMINYDERNWSNLVLWLLKCLQSQCNVWVPTPEDDPGYDTEPIEHKLISSLFDSIFTEPRMTAEQLDQLLGCMRPTFVAIDRDWAKD